MPAKIALLISSAFILRYETKGPVKLICEVDLDRLLPTQSERRRFDNNWESFLASDKYNKKIFHLRKHILQYESEQLYKLDYEGSFRIGLCVFISMPSAPGGKWGALANHRI